MNNLILPLNVPSIDIFITYKCGLRCAHCFVGESLNLNTDMDFNLFEKLVKTVHEWNTKEITFLGGEPTLYPKLIEAVELAHKQNLKTRIVTNGHRSYSRFINNFKSELLPFICFSVDGSNENLHDLIRGKGSFAILIENISHSKRLGYQIAGIVSISRQNVNDISNILRLCEFLEFDYVNIHYVTNRGFATTDMVLSINEWKKTCETIEKISNDIKLEIRIEKTFYPKDSELNCAVVEKSNLMFYPDGRVFMCMMFIDLPNAHSFVWTENGLELNQSLNNEQFIVKNKTSLGCPAMKYVNRSIVNEAESKKEFIQCIYDKQRL